MYFMGNILNCFEQHLATPGGDSLSVSGSLVNIKFIFANNLMFSHHLKTIFIFKSIIIVCEKRKRSELRAEIKKCEMDSGLLYLLIVSDVARIQVWHQHHTFPHSLHLKSHTHTHARQFSCIFFFSFPPLPTPSSSLSLQSLGTVFSQDYSLLKWKKNI